MIRLRQGVTESWHPFCIQITNYLPNRLHGSAFLCNFVPVHFVYDIFICSIHIQ